MELSRSTVHFLYAIFLYDLLVLSCCSGDNQASRAGYGYGDACSKASSNVYQLVYTLLMHLASLHLQKSLPKALIYGMLASENLS
jgi:hypothetical protein